MSRSIKFNKLQIHNTNPDYKAIKKLYISGEIESIATASKLLNMVRYTAKNKIFKASTQNKLKLDSIISGYKRIIKPNMTLNQMNDKLNNNLMSSSKAKIDDKEIKTLMSNLSTDKKYYLEATVGSGEKRIYTIDRKTQGFKKMLNSDYMIHEGIQKDSDSETTSEYKEIKKYKIVELKDNFFDDDGIKTKKRKMNRNNGKFKYLNNHEGVDLSEYQIYKKGDIMDHKNCVIYALEKAGIDKQIINNLIIKFSDVSETSQTDINFRTFEYIAQKQFNDVSKAINRQITVSKIERQITKITYGEPVEGFEPIQMATYENHIFLNEPTVYKKYAIKNYENLKDRKDWNLYSSNDHKNRGAFLSSLEVVILLKAQEKLTPIKLTTEDGENDIKLSNSDLLGDLEGDQRLFNYKPKAPRKTNIYFGDLENINNTNEISSPFLAGIVNINSEKDPKIYTGLDCITYMLEYVFINNKFGHDNIYFHNMKYDFSLMKQTTQIINICEKDNQIYSVELLYKKVKITLKDSYKVFGEKLSNFSKISILSRKVVRSAYDGISC